MSSKRRHSRRCRRSNASQSPGRRTPDAKMLFVQQQDQVRHSRLGIRADLAQRLRRPESHRGRLVPEQLDERGDQRFSGRTDLTDLKRCVAPVLGVCVLQAGDQRRHRLVRRWLNLPERHRGSQSDLEVAIGQVALHRWSHGFGRRPHSAQPVQGGSRGFLVSKELHECRKRFRVLGIDVHQSARRSKADRSVWILQRRC